MLLLQKCIENDDKIGQKKVINLCYNENNILQYRNLLAKKWKGQGIKLLFKNKFKKKQSIF